tara:strand:- start:341 stop:1528 length:1188 start_codon:yes stop_codon:yes gene_type:complete
VEIDLPSGGADYGFGGSDSFTLGSENVSATGPSGGSSDGDRRFFGGSDTTQDGRFDPNNPNIMDFGRGSVSNIGNAANYDPNFAALGMMDRGLTPGFDLRNQINFDVPASMLPQLEGSRGPLAPKFYSPVERALVEMEPVGIMASAGKVFTDFMKDNFTDAKNALGKMGDATGGFSLSDLVSGIFSSESGQNAVNNMADNTAFDASGNRIELASLSQKGADYLPAAPTNPILNRVEVNKQLLDSMNSAGTGYASAAGSLFPRTTENSPNFSVSGDENLGMTIDRMGLNKYSLNARNPDFQIEMNRLKPAERAFLTGRTDTISPTDSTYDDDFQKTADAGKFNLLQGLGSYANPKINEFLQQNISPKLRFDTNPKRDPNDPNRLMPYLGFTYDFTV